MIALVVAYVNNIDYLVFLLYSISMNMPNWEHWHLLQGGPEAREFYDATARVDQLRNEIVLQRVGPDVIAAVESRQELELSPTSELSEEEWALYDRMLEEDVRQLEEDDPASPFAPISAEDEAIMTARTFVEDIIEDNFGNIGPYKLSGLDKGLVTFIHLRSKTRSQQLLSHTLTFSVADVTSGLQMIVRKSLLPYALAGRETSELLLDGSEGSIAIETVTRLGTVAVGLEGVLADLQDPPSSTTE